jgi:serine/threonine-protein phosphatase 2A regulatory subunit A
VFGVAWAAGAIVPKVAAMAEHPNYLYRMTTCFAVSVSLHGEKERLLRVAICWLHLWWQTLAPALTLPTLSRALLPILHQLVEDPIPNIRFNVAKSYAVLIAIFKRLPDDDTTLAELEKDPNAMAGAQGTPKGEEVIRGEIMPPLEKLMGDDDVDVRFFATTAAKSWTDGEVV